MKYNGKIYIIKNKVNNLVYIGLTTGSLKDRFYNHTKPSTCKKRGSYKLYNAMNKHGTDNFYIELIKDNIPAKKLEKLEIHYIDKYNSYNRGYNTTQGGNVRRIFKEKDLKQLKKMFHLGHTYKDIGAYFDVHKDTIQRTLHGIGLRRKHNVPRQFLLDNIHKTNKQMADDLGVHDMTISRAFKKHQIPRGKGFHNIVLNKLKIKNIHAKLYKKHFKLYDYCMNKLGIQKIIDYVNTSNVNKEQLNLFNNKEVKNGDNTL
jgi:group I intron endonuclease